MSTCSVEGCDSTVYCRGLCVKHYRRWIAGTQSTCSIDECNNVVMARGFCVMHYMRWSRYGDPLAVFQAEDGEPQAFIEMALKYTDKEECLYWPYGRTSNGYATLGKSIEGSSLRVSRIICEKVHGPPPTTKHQAAHSCGKGHLACINPHHLRWDTSKGNAADKVIHGTIISGEQINTAKLTSDNVREIRTMQGILSAYKVGSIFGVSHTAIYDIWHGKTWREDHAKNDG